MNNHITRMREEHLDLDDKIRKLAFFIADPSPDAVFPTLDRTDKFLLVRQLDAMNGYAAILKERLERVRAQ
jgi:hypothetical protein